MSKKNESGGCGSICLLTERLTRYGVESTTSRLIVTSTTQVTIRNKLFGQPFSFNFYGVKNGNRDKMPSFRL